MRWVSVILPLIAIFTAFPLLSQEAKPKGNKYAILIGVNLYSKPGYEPLKFAERDMSELKAVLEKAGFRVTLLLGSGEGEAEATRENINRVLLDKQKSVLATVTQEDTVLVAMSGHGEQIQVGGKEIPYYAPKHAVSGDADTQISINDILDSLDKRGGGSNLLLVDACRKSARRVEGKKSGAIMDRGKVQSVRANIGVMFACADRQETLEHQLAGDGHGLFFYSVLEAFKSTEKNSSGHITWEQLVPKIRTKVKALADQLDSSTPAERRQRPHYIGNFIEDPVLIVGGLPEEDNGETIEEFEWKGEKRKRTVTKVNLGGEVLEFVTVPAGSFLMGSPDSDNDVGADEKPQHRVTFSKANRVGKFTITKGQFAAFVKATGYQTEAETDSKGGFGFDGTGYKKSKIYTWKNTGWPQTDRHPVVNVSHNDAVAYCEWASKQAKRTIRLLTEAEYDYANRANTTTRYFTGDDAESLEGYANIADRSWKAKYPKATIVDFDDGEPFTARVGKFKPNGFGLYDTTGNVFCWCADWYDEKAYNRGDVRDPKSVDSGEKTNRVLRGGSWDTDGRFCRGAFRGWTLPGNRNNVNGFRVCLPQE